MYYDSLDWSTDTKPAASEVTAKKSDSHNQTGSKTIYEIHPMYHTTYRSQFHTIEVCCGGLIDPTASESAHAKSVLQGCSFALAIASHKVPIDPSSTNQPGGQNTSIRARKQGVFNSIAAQNVNLN